MWLIFGDVNYFTLNGIPDNVSDVCVVWGGGCFESECNCQEERACGGGIKLFCLSLDFFDWVYNFFLVLFCEAPTFGDFFQDEFSVGEYVSVKVVEWFVRLRW